MAIGLNITNIWPNLLKSKTYLLDTGIVGNLCAHHQYPDNWQGPRGNRPIVSFARLIIQQPTNLIRHWEREIRLLQSSLRSTNSLGGWPRTHPAVMRWMVAIVRAGQDRLSRYRVTQPTSSWVKGSFESWQSHAISPPQGGVGTICNSAHIKSDRQRNFPSGPAIKILWNSAKWLLYVAPPDAGLSKEPLVLQSGELWVCRGLLCPGHFRRLTLSWLTCRFNKEQSLLKALCGLCGLWPTMLLFLRLTAPATGAVDKGSLGEQAVANRKTKPCRTWNIDNCNNNDTKPQLGDSVI